MQLIRQRTPVHSCRCCPRLVPAGHSSLVARTLSQVCTSWRRGLGEERAALQQLRFSRLELLPTPGSGGNSATAGAARQPGRTSRPALPWLVQQAVKAGNVAATVAAARWLERQQGPGREPGSRRPTAPRSAAAAAALAGTWYNGCIAAAAAVQAAAAAGAADSAYPAEAARHWRKAAKLGHPEAQWKLGWGHYKVCSPWASCLAAQCGHAMPFVPASDRHAPRRPLCCAVRCRA